MALRLIRALPGERRFLSPLPRQHRPARIDATVAAPGPHDFAVRRGILVQRANPPDAAASIASGPTYRDDRETPLCGPDEDNLLPIYGIVKRIFRISGLTVSFILKSLGNQ